MSNAYDAPERYDFWTKPRSRDEYEKEVRSRGLGSGALWEGFRREEVERARAEINSRAFREESQQFVEAVRSLMKEVPPDVIKQLCLRMDAIERYVRRRLANANIRKENDLNDLRDWEREWREIYGRGRRIG